EILRGRTVKRDVAQLVAGSSIPAAVVPRPDDQAVELPRIVPLESLVDREGTVEVLLVPPARDAQRRNEHVADVGDHRLPLPEFVVVRMFDEVVPRGDLSLKEECVDVGERAEGQVPAVGVVPVESELLQLLSALQLVRILEAVAQAECPVVM